MHFFSILLIALLPVVKHKHVVIAHRGDHTVLPENTLAAYTRAIADGVDYVEVDLRTFKDGTLYISHGSLEVLPAGVPSFEQVLSLCKKKVNIYLDFKDADPLVVYKLIKKAGMEKHIVVYCNTFEQLKEWHKVAPGMPLMTSVPDSVLDLNTFFDQYPVSAIDGDIGRYTPEMLAVCKKRNVAIWLDVQAPDEGPLSWQQALDTPVQGLQTDHPGALINYLKQKGNR
ncbi:glycerophosphodiester phosphodiesterase family protein [Chitinophaga sp.]|uniref:glycerophosphodiester phosphodiesterase family protein n=1 Tax=Chitinophaga sp. TaxID=1869181 RepID=UPI0031E2B4E2